ncbi:AraC-type DNA-binding protein [Pedobacter westerhofensis]|uniref:AraC-type DNA-binding protein n=1 Tax=Pedobacter westerhofensis TaxID=425512 RepID=A0A521FGV4_9SPHI|nr:helix-turn-helix domain-containing protein [Pedobacter westerhofensis]SMO95438.1 AraC-type DNA-binding protein [Pedobacter westerhofensis]
MYKASLFPEGLSQNEKLPIRIVSPDFGHIGTQSEAAYGVSNQLPYYFFLFVLKGSGHRRVDLESFDLEDNELIFSLPYQIVHLPESFHGKDYFKLGFDQECLSKLPKQYSFLLNPLNQPKIKISESAGSRLKAIFLTLKSLLKTSDTDPELILAHLHGLLTEIDSAYFGNAKRPGDAQLEKFISFKLFLENNLTDHPSIKAIAEELAISTESLQHIVKQYSGCSPKEFITNRLILEARRRLYYGEHSSVKELAFELGFNDPDYFNRVFKKVTGKTVAESFQDLS